MVRFIQLMILLLPTFIVPMRMPEMSPENIRSEVDAIEADLIRGAVCGEEPSLSLYGNCRITFYCPCSRCCGKSDGITASGVKATANHTVAGTLPFGTRLMIEDQEYVVEDRGVGDMQIDIYVDSHSEALQRGMYYTDVYIIDED